MLNSADTRKPEVSGLDRSFFGHPRGLMTLFGAETWERFSFHGPLVSGWLGQNRG